MVVHRTAATGFMDRRDADAEAVEHPRRGRVGVGCQARLHTAFEHQYTACMAGRGAWFAGAEGARQFVFEAGRHQWPENLADLGQTFE
ncbi:hypothetical protein D3C80_2041780 [compost metagenome]